MQAFEEFEEAFFFFVYAKNFGRVVESQLGKRDSAFLAKLGESAAQGNSMRTGFVSREALHEQCFNFRGDGMLHALGFCMSFCPGQADDFREKHFGELVAEREVLGDFAALGGEKNPSTAFDLDVAIASHALDRCSNRRWSDVKFFGQTGADGHVVFFEHFPNGFKVIFSRNAGFVALQGVSRWWCVANRPVRSSKSSGAKAQINRQASCRSESLASKREIQETSVTSHETRLL